MDIYSLEDRTVDHILDLVDAEMSAEKQPKVLLFDIGGVCVKSPFQAILDYELSLGIPPGWINYSISKTAPNGFWHKLERGEIPMDSNYFRGFNEDLHHAGRWQEFYRREQGKDPRLPREVPPQPRIDGEWLFNEMMTASNFPDPWMFPALKKLKASGRYILAALSNTVIFPPGHKLHTPNYFDDPVRGLFDVFISSAHVGLRKPDPKMYQFALEQVDRYARDYGWHADGVKPEDILFLDDIGENLKQARIQGFRTVKVNLGRAYEAVEELEKVTGLQLAGDHPKIPIKPKYPAKAKI
ncbi:Acyl-CoA dehydrogenase family member-like protein [Hapsidospora chrysogenum ATCC 11550]|uniref:Acyl-CoA dehydrogenase family member-like protein n=1 Tax=Hapsidospora chrysogenum (strain ATCC 11550 / CBS 779.69 / DSM 880 / IAM 14645 / JCM 23072 / IMI 49137) TaxID=857340 RepID=A0A086TBX1_HAPC1|nr:Acyl-CoA dehydrogenase family member-like protein [Hapsidospora chrysogenum ATCC 11550]